MDEIINALKDYIIGLNCGRWDYIFSYIKVFRNHRKFLLPDRFQIGSFVFLLKEKKTFHQSLFYHYRNLKKKDKFLALKFFFFKKLTIFLIS